MRSRILVCALAIAAASIAGPATADDAAVRKALEGCYAQVTRAFQNRDMKAMMANLTPDYTTTTANGRTLTRAQIEADFTEQSGRLTDVKWVRRIEALTVHGDLAVATLRSKLTAGTKDASGREHRFELDTHSRDTWARQGKVWKAKHVQVLEQVMHMDGKALGTPAGAPPRKG